MKTLGLIGVLVYIAHTRRQVLVIGLQFLIINGLLHLLPAAMFTV